MRGLVLLAVVAAAPIVVVACKTVTTSTDTQVAASASIAASASTSASASASASVSASAAIAASASVSVSASASAPKVDCDKAFKAMQAGPSAVKAKYRGCSTDADCVTVPGRACLGSCDGAIAKAGVAEHERAMKATDAACDAFVKGPCMYSYPIAVPTCPMMIPRCVGGACTAQYR